MVGRIPYERIAHIDWEPDPVYSAPRFYAEYGWRGPYREVVLYEQASSAFRMRARDGSLIELPDVSIKGKQATLGDGLPRRSGASRQRTFFAEKTGARHVTCGSSGPTPQCHARSRRANRASGASRPPQGSVARPAYRVPLRRWA